jgi:hypothetical protein
MRRILEIKMDKWGRCRERMWVGEGNGGWGM